MLGTRERFSGCDWGGVITQGPRNRPDVYWNTDSWYYNALGCPLAQWRDASILRSHTPFLHFSFCSDPKLWTELGLRKVTLERAITEPKQPSPLITTVQSWWRFLNANHKREYSSSIEPSPPRADRKDPWISRPVRATDGKSIGYWRALFAVKKRMQFKCNAFRVWL